MRAAVSTLKLILRAAVGVPTLLSPEATGPVSLPVGVSSMTRTGQGPLSDHLYAGMVKSSPASEEARTATSPSTSQHAGAWLGLQAT